ncbi:hypothetical protein GF354_02395, partial [Candidatus Peregrinibacteria bacterium]|nr:hypothetical protein [Candidatus Peregrinibacteria bacterium]
MYKLRRYLTKLFVFTVILMAFASLEASAARFYLSPASGSYTSGCETAVNIVIDTEGQNSKGADAILNYNPAEIEIIDQDADMPGVQIKAGSKSIFEIYPYNSVNTSTGKIYLAGASMFSSYKTAGSGDVYGTIIFKSKTGVSSSNISFDFSPGSTTDSNISAVDSSDLLTGVANGNYSFAAGQSCVEDTKPPYIVSTNPKNGERNVLLDSNISFVIRDDLSGVNLDSVVVDVDGIEYRRGDSGFSYTGDKSSYAITINPTNNFPDGRKVNVEIDAEDIRGRIMSTYRFSFNEPIVDGDPPYITSVTP